MIAEQAFDYEFTLSGSTWHTWYTDRYESEWTYEFDVIGRYVKRHAPDPNSSPTVIAYDAEHNVTSYSAGGSAALTATWGPGTTLTFLRLPGAGFVEEDEWNEVTFDWERPDPNGSPNFWRVAYAEDALGNDVQFLYGDPNDATRNTEMIETLDGGDPVWVDGRENIIPSTGFGGFDRYWLHDGTLEPEPTVKEAFFHARDAAGPPEDEPIVTLGAHDWRWRGEWVIPGFALHLGVIYKHGAGYRYLDYGQRPDKQGCSFVCCALPVKFSNNKQWRDRTTGIGGDKTSWRSGTSSTQYCFENQPRNWGGCCYYFFTGTYPASNSNGGIRKSMSSCDPANRYPSCTWLWFAWGWANQSFSASNTVCPGYRGDRD